MYMTPTFLKPCSQARRPSTTPCAASEGAVRKRKSLSSSTVMLGAVEAPEICTT